MTSLLIKTVKSSWQEEMADKVSALVSELNSLIQRIRDGLD